MYQSVVGAVSRTLPRGRDRISGWLARHPGHNIAYVDVNGHRRTADLRDHLERQWFAGVNFGLPPSVTRRIAAGAWAMDLGANIGVVSGQLAKRVGIDGLVWAVEPVPRNVSRLAELVRDNELCIEVIPVAVGASDGEATLRLHEGSGYASMTASWVDAGRMTVPLRSVDSLVMERSPQRRLAFMKIDVEGFEPEVLAGAYETLAHHRPLLYVEFNDVILRDRGFSSSSLLEAFAGAGYRPVPEYSEGATRLDGRVLDVLLEPSMAD